MTVFANVNGENKELYRIFFNDNGVIREVESFHAQNDNNEIKELFVRDSNAPSDLQWVAYDGDSSTINSVTNNGYTINGRFTDKKRSISTIYKKRLLFNTKIRVELSNTKYDTDVVVSDRVYIYLFDTESFSDHAQYSYSTGSPATMNVMNTGDYYIALCVYGRDSSGNNHYCTTDANITILPPK